MTDEPEDWLITFRPLAADRVPVTVRVRRLLKFAMRGCRLRCMGVLTRPRTTDERKTMPKPKPKRRSKTTERTTRNLLRLICEVLPAESLGDPLKHAGELLDKCLPRLEQISEAQLADLEACARQHGFDEQAAEYLQERRRREKSSSPAS